MIYSVWVWFGLFGVSLITSTAILCLFGVISLRSRPEFKPNIEHGVSAYLFEGDALVDHHAGVLPPAQTDELAWRDFKEWLELRFANLPESLAGVSHNNVHDHVEVAAATGDPAVLSLTNLGKRVRVILSDKNCFDPSAQHEIKMLSFVKSKREEMVRSAPYPIWATSHTGEVIWQNEACDTQVGGVLLNTNISMPPPDQIRATRVPVSEGDTSGQTWFEIQSQRIGTEIRHYAMDISKIIRAERVQHEFVQTLTKTFAYLDTGLAVFDKNRQLALFNPALLDLTSLPATYLSGRPDLMNFFDRLRNEQVMPEPRSYSDWRIQILRMIKSAEHGEYQETWALPNETTFRVTGRPHPDGAVAFLFEDISAEILLTRGFRSDLDQRHAVLDSINEPIVVSDAAGVLTFCNSACRDHFRIDPDSSFSNLTMHDIVSAGKITLPDRTFWESVRKSLVNSGPNKHIEISGTSKNGELVHARISSLKGGAQLLHIRAPIHSKTIVSPKTSA